MKSVSILTVLVSMGVLVASVACTETITKVVTPDAGASSSSSGDAGKVTTKPSGDDDDTTGDDDDTTGDDDDTTGDDDDTTGDDDDDKPPTVADCKKTTEQNACVQCCQGYETPGAQFYAKEFQKCLCGDKVCKDACKTTYCAATPKNPDQACNTCANEAQATCGEPVLTACTANAACKKFNDCLDTAKCQTKPAQQ